MIPIPVILPRNSLGFKPTNYVGAFIYKNDTLSYINLPEGRLLPSGGTFAYEYHLRDHLGNTRATYTPTTNGNSRLTQYTNYYPSAFPSNGALGKLTLTIQPKTPTFTTAKNYTKN